MRKFITKTIAILLFLNSLTALASTPHYAIIIDAGSSGSRLHLFQYDEAKPLPHIVDTFSESTSPGLSAFSQQPEAAGPSLKKLLDDAAVKLGQQHIDQKNVSIDILATAGMRLLPTDNQQKIYRNINDYLKSNYHFNIRRIETISGKMEGVYGWLNVNYLADRFANKDKKTFGIIDMGGASSEIAFATSDQNKQEDVLSLTIANQPYTIYSKSILGSGQDKTREIMNVSQNSGACYPTNYKNNAIIGQFNYATCTSLYSTVIQSFLKQNEIPYLDHTDFVAYSSIYYAFHFFEVDKTPTKESIAKSIQNVCSNSWENLIHNPKYANVPEKYLANYCANGIYQTDLLFDNYKVNGQRLLVLENINNQNIDWTLGALLFELL